jgi:hypothetical protein
VGGSFCGEWFWNSEEAGIIKLITSITLRAPVPASSAGGIFLDKQAGMGGFDMGWSRLWRYQKMIEIRLRSTGKAVLAARVRMKNNQKALENSTLMIRLRGGRIYLWGSGFGILRRLELNSSSQRSLSEPPVPASSAGGIILVRQAGMGGFGQGCIRLLLFMSINSPTSSDHMGFEFRVIG